MSRSRRGIHFNDKWQSWNSDPVPSAGLVRAFHASLQGHQPTPLIKLDDLANDIGVRAVYMKNEGSRFGLPSFKILGASWGTFRAIALKLNLPLNFNLDAVKRSLVGQNTSLFAATDGNHGRAVSRIGCWLGIPVVIHVPAGMYRSTIGFIESEGAHVCVSTGNYDQAVLEAQAAAEKAGGILVQDFAFGEYVDIPQWIVDGYSTMMFEIEEQLKDEQATHVFAPIGVGSFAQAVTTHFRCKGSATSIIGVEPDTAACLWKSLSRGTPTAIETLPTIMAGLDCGTVSTTAWPILSKGLRASLTVSDFEAHYASVYLQSCGISAGPCSGSTVAALRRLSSKDRTRLGINSDSVIILPCTEGARDYDLPLDVSIEDHVKLAQLLEQITSANSSMSSAPGHRETAIARYIAAWLEHRDLEYEWTESTSGRPSIVAMARNYGSSKSLIFDSYIWTDDNDIFGDAVRDSKLQGRRLANRECDAATAMVALTNSKNLGLHKLVV